MIALDIDGTLTADWHTIPDEVEAYLHSLYKRGYVIAIFTGRPYRWAEPILKKFTFPLYVALQNGAIILETPGKRIVKRHYLSTDHFAALDPVCARHATSFVIYSGVEHSDQCFYRPNLFSKDELAYLRARAANLKEAYVKLESFDQFQGMEFPSYKCLGEKEKMTRLANEIRSVFGWHVPVIVDRYNTGYCVAQMTMTGVDKGSALRDCLQITGVKGPVIAAGDDHNDLEMLAVADIKIVMSTAPPEVLAIADIVAPPAEELGIIEGLKRCVNK